MKKLILILLLACNIHANAQDDKTVTLVVSGQGKTQDEAKQNALRSAIEQAFGTFISSKTEILNDKLVKDEIVSVSNGNIKKFEIISEVQIPNGVYATSLKATVSVSKLSSFVESKGVVVEFKGSLFAFNVNQQILNEKNEIKAIEDLCSVITKLSDASFDYSIKVSDPVAVNGSNEKWRIPMYISVSANNNLLKIAKYMNQTLKGLSLSIDEANNYIKLGKKIFPISFAANENEYDYIVLRTESGILLINQLYYFNHSIQNFKISNGLLKWEIKQYPENLKYIYDNKFRIFIRKWNGGDQMDAYRKESVFYPGMGSDCFKSGTTELSYGRYCKPILNYLYLMTSYLEAFQTDLSHKEVGSDHNFHHWEYDFIDQFTFVNKLNNIINSQSGVIISFIGIEPEYEIVRFYYEDIKTLEEINKITEYKVIPNY